MFSETINLIKLWIVVKAASCPITWIVCLGLFTILLILSAIFIRFRNGWVSVVSFILLELLAIGAIVSLTSRHLGTEDLKLDKGKAMSCIDVTSEGVVIRKRFRTVTVSLLGLRLPDSESVHFDSAKDLILQSRFSGNLYVQYSSVYSGVVLCDSNFNSLNEELLKQGLSSVDIVSPKKYVSLQKKAIKGKRGMWEFSSYQKSRPSILEYSVTWLIFVSSVCLTLVVTTWLKKVVVKHEQKSFQIDLE